MRSAATAMPASVEGVVDRPARDRAALVADDLQVPAPGHPRVEGGLFDHRPDLGEPLGARHPRSEHPRLAAVGPDQAEQHPGGRGLAGAVGAEEAEHLALFDIEVQAVDDGAAAVTLGEPAASNGQHAELTVRGATRRAVDRSLS